MKITPLKRKTTATALTNPDPSFVSMCKGVSPANQEPFRAIRSEDPDAPKEVAPMKMTKVKASSNVTAIAQKGYGVMQFQFDKNVFKTADDVTKWLDEGGYSDYQVVERATSFEVNDEDGAYEVGSVSPVTDAADGVKAFVGRMTSGSQTADDSGADVVKKTEDEDRASIQPRQRAKKKPVDSDGEEAEKDDDYDPKKPKDKDDAEDDMGDTKKTPKGKNAPDSTFAISSEDAEEVRSKFADAIDGMPTLSRKHIHPYIISDIACALSTLKYIILDADYTGIDDVAVADLKKAALAGADAMVAVAEQLKGEIGTFLAAKVAEIADEADAKATKTEAGNAPVSEEPIPNAVLDERFKAIETKFEGRLKAAEDKVDAAEVRAKKAEDDLAARVAEDESRAQSRKAADGLDNEDEAAPVKRSRASQNMLSAFGSRKANM